jgi:transposase
LRDGLIRAAWAATYTKQTYLPAQFKRLVRVTGKKRALIAVGHSIIVIAYHVLKQQKSFEGEGDYFERQNVELQRSRLIAEGKSSLMIKFRSSLHYRSDEE